MVLGCKSDVADSSYSNWHSGRTGKRRGECLVLEKSEIAFWIGFWCIYLRFLFEATTLVRVADPFLSLLLLFGIVFLAIRVLAIFSDRGIEWISILGLSLSLISYLLSGDTIFFSTMLL